MGKSLFVFKPDHVIDLITNSSSELFVLKSETIDSVTSMVEEIYPGYLEEYSKPMLFKDLDVRDIETYILVAYSGPGIKIKTIEGFEEREMWLYEEKWKCHILVDDFISKNSERIKKGIDPNDEMFFMFSLNMNCNLEMRDKLMTLGDHHRFG